MSPRIGVVRSVAVFDGRLSAAIIKRFTLSVAVIDRVGLCPRQGVSSIFWFERGLRIIEGVIGGMITPVSYFSTAVWKRHVHLGNDKDELRQKAIEAWPESASLHFCRMRYHGTAEAVLIALWLVRTRLGWAWRRSGHDD